MNALHFINQPEEKPMKPRKTYTTQRMLTGLLASAAIAPLLAAAPALAQDTSGEEEVARFNEVVVTARRREESLQDVPLSVTAFSGETLEAIGAVDITYVGQATPNTTLEVSRGTNSTLTAFIRGVGQQDPVAGFEQGVGLYLDDVYLNRPQGAVLDIYDVQRIEVLRGPQGTLYGRNTIGGAVKYVTRPLSDEPTLKVRGSYGSNNQADLVITGSYPISDTLRVGGSIAKLTRDGFGDNLTTGEENYNKDVTAGRLSLEWEPVSSVMVRLSGDYTKDTSDPRQGHRLLPSAVSPSPILSDYDTRAGITQFGPITENDVTASGVNLTVQWDVNDQITVKSITSYREDDTSTPIDFDSTAARSFDVPADYTNEQFSQELQLTYEGEKFQGVLGYYYLDANAFNAFDVIFTSLSSFTLGDVDTETWAIFGELTFNMTDKLAMTFGGRYTVDERTSRVFRALYLGVPSPYFGNAAAISLTAPVVVNGQEVVPDFNGTREDEAFTPRVILSYAPSDTVSLFASVSEGFKGGGFDPRGNFANADVRRGFRPESVRSYELGAKTSWFNNRATANVTYFQADYTDVQIPGSVIVQTPTGVNFVGTVTNAGAADFKGIEFEGSALFTDNLSGAMSFGYIDAEYTEFVVGGVNLASQRAVQNTPDWTGNATLNYSTPFSLFGAGDLNIIGSASYRGDSQQFETPIALLDQEAFWLFDASVVWTREDGKLKVGLHGKNLADERYITSGYNFPGAGTDNSVLAFYGNPSTVTLSVDYSF